MICKHYVWMRTFLKTDRMAPFSIYPDTYMMDRAVTNDVSKTVVSLGPFPSQILGNLR